MFNGKTRFKSVLFLAVILAVAVFFRFYKLLELQYYSFDDEVAATFMYNLVVNKKLILVGTTATLDIPLGAWWYWLSAPIYKLANFNPVTILTVGSALGVIATYVVYWVGKNLFSQRVGWLGALLYGGSFLTGLFDRRWWIVSINPILLMVAVYSLKQIVEGKLKFALPLAVAASFAWQGDLTLAIIPLAIVISFMVFRLPVKIRAYLPALIWLIISVSPLAIFEWRHPGAVTTPYLKLFNRASSGGQGYNQTGNLLTPGQITLGVARGFWSKPTQTAEDYIYPFADSSSLDFSWAAKAVVLWLILFPVYLGVKQRVNRKTLGLMYILVTAFLIGIVGANVMTKVRISLYYYLTIWPVLFLLAGFTLAWLWEKKQKIIVVAFLSLFLWSNIQALVNSRMRYPLNQKMQLVNLVADNLESKPFSFYPLEDMHLYGGGLGGILMARNLFPSNRSYYGFDWTYRAFSLYQVPVMDEDKFDQRVVVYPEWLQPDWTVYQGVAPAQNFQVSNIKATILRPAEKEL